MEHRPDPRLLALLAWYRDMGVTDALASEPIDWLARGDRPIREREPDPPAPDAARRSGPAPRGAGLEARAPATAVPARSFAAMPSAEAEDAARSATRSARTIEELRAALDGFEGCALRATAKNLCFYRGAPQARLMVIGEAPGREEDLEGKPFVGRAGQLLDRMLAAIGLGEADVHITNVVYWRPPGNRTPTPQEVLACRPFVMRQIELVQPDMLLLLGAVAAKHVLGVSEGILRVRGKWRQVEIAGRRIPTMATLHPAYLLRTPSTKRLAWRDLLAVRARLDEGARPGAAGNGSS
ncbi:MAG: uracil-DNA glycosylase [Hyphomicrobiaceae bacterium]|nr:uracil-DNA glycosylase [Hyphomicrobiaceae bacterium]